MIDLVVAIVSGEEGKGLQIKVNEAKQEQRVAAVGQ